MARKIAYIRLNEIPIRQKWTVDVVKMRTALWFPALCDGRPMMMGASNRKTRKPYGPRVLSGRVDAIRTRNRRFWRPLLYR